jgi:hypothetical protein
MSEIKNIYVDGTLKSPHIDFNQHTGELILSGKSIPENAAKVYEPLVLWANEYIKSPRKITNLRLNLEYFNSSSSLWIVKIIKALSKISDDECILYIHVYFENEDYEDIDVNEIKDTISSLVDNIGDIKISLEIKAYNTDNSGNILKESTILV